MHAALAGTEISTLCTAHSSWELDALFWPLNTSEQTHTQTRQTEFKSVYFQVSMPLVCQRMTHSWIFYQFSVRCTLSTVFLTSFQKLFFFFLESLILHNSM